MTKHCYGASYLFRVLIGRTCRRSWWFDARRRKAYITPENGSRVLDVGLGWVWFSVYWKAQ